MPKPSKTAEINSFVGGLISEASPLTFPPNASVSEDNFVLNRDGTRDRRLGMDFEENYQLITTGYTAAALGSLAITPYRWDDVAEIVGQSFLVIQFGSNLHIYDITVSDVTQDGLKEVVAIANFDGSATLSFTSVDGQLVLAGGEGHVWVMTYANNAFTVETRRLLVRDLWGVDASHTEGGTTYNLNEGNETSRRPNALSRNHMYNLRNQSFSKARRIESTDALGDPIQEVFANGGRFPSNSDMIWAGMGFETIADQTREEFDGGLMIDASEGSAAAGRGSFIIDALTRGASRDAAIAANIAREPALTRNVGGSVLADVTPGGATQVAEFSGRIFYGGFSGAVTNGDSRSPKLSSYLLFSQLVENSADINLCYQDGDPASRSESDILATDGGFLRISGMGQCLKMQVLANKLIVIASNGVWVLTGGSDFGFAADNYLVSKVSEFGALGAGSVVEAGGAIYYWATNGIYRLGADQFGELSSENITLTTIQTLYEEYDPAAKEAVVGLFDKYANKVRWLFDIQTDILGAKTPTKELVLDLSIGAFYPSTIGITEGITPYPVALVETPPFRLGLSTDNIVVGGHQLAVNEGTDVLVTITSIRSTGTRSIKYITVVQEELGSSWTLASYRDPDFKDWDSHEGAGVDAPAFLVTGALTAGQSDIDKQVNYLTMFLRKTEDGVREVDGDWVPTGQSSCMLQSRWGWANSAASGRWSREFQTYRHSRHFFPSDLGGGFDDGFDLVVSKSKLRGKGKSVTLYMRTEPEKDCRILGWALAINGNSVV